MVAKTDRGRIRESNQDAYFVGEMPDGTAFAVVCDGMGGAAGGNIASSLAVQVISSKINASYHPNMRDSSICNMLESALSAANVEVYDLAQEKADLRGMGTTVVCAVIRGGQAFIAHAGDSRAYLFSADGLQQVTTDHSMVQDLLESGKITPDEAKHHPNKNIITRAIGVDSAIKIDFDQIDFSDGQVRYFVRTVFPTMWTMTRWSAPSVTVSIMLMRIDWYSRPTKTAAVIILPLLPSAIKRSEQI